MAAEKVAEKGSVPEMVKVIINRPQGVTDSHLFIGFNGLDTQVAFNKEVSLPKHVVEHIQGIEGVEYTCDEKGAPVPNYFTKYSVRVL